MAYSLNRPACIEDQVEQDWFAGRSIEHQTVHYYDPSEEELEDAGEESPETSLGTLLQCAGLI